MCGTFPKDVFWKQVSEATEMKHVFKFNMTTLTFCVAHNSPGHIHIPVPRRQSVIQGTQLQVLGPQMFPGLKKFLKKSTLI